MSELKSYAQKALSLMDLTSLNENDTKEVIEALAQKAKTDFGTPAALCVYPAWIETAKNKLKELDLENVKVATVTNFPSGAKGSEVALAETLDACQKGADEVDIVFPYRALIEGDEIQGFELVQKAKEICVEHKALLKVIIETGELKTESLIRKASEISIKAGADFIKTSTGKVPVNATLESARIMLETIRDLGVSDSVGFKAAGGVQTAAQAKEYLDQAATILGDNFVCIEKFRFGASSLLANLLATLTDTQEQKVTGY